jgi:DNA adenine methylase
VEAAQLFYYLNRTSFNGLCRFNSSGLFNVPGGMYKGVEYERDLIRYRRLLRQWQFVSSDFEKLKIERGDFIYCDPPYFGPAIFDKYTPGGFSWEDHVRLAEWLARHRGPVLLSNHASSRIARLYRRLGFSLRYLSGPRRISANGVRSTVREVLAGRNL